MLNQDYLQLLDMLDAEAKSDRKRNIKAICGAVFLAVTAFVVVVIVI